MSLTVIMPRSLKRVVDHQHLLDAVLVQQRNDFVPVRALPDRDQALLGRHDRWRPAASRLVSKRRSRLVTMPTRSSPSTTGTPEMLLARVSSRTSRMRGGRRHGDRIVDHPALEFLDRAHLARPAARQVMFLWMMPMPPSWARAMASAGLGDRIHGSRHQRDVQHRSPGSGGCTD